MLKVTILHENIDSLKSQVSQRHHQDFYVFLHSFLPSALTNLPGKEASPQHDGVFLIMCSLAYNKHGI